MAFLNITVVIPCFNEEGNIQSLVEEVVPILDRSYADYCIYFVDDASTDMTVKELRLVADLPKVKVDFFKRNQGPGAVYRHVLRECKTDFITWLPADGEIDPRFLGNQEVLKAISQGHFLVTYPYESRNRTWMRRVLSKTFTRIMNLTFRCNFEYYNGSAIYPADELKKIRLRSERFGFNLEALVKMKKLNDRKLSYKEVPFQLRKRNFGVSSAIRWSVFIDVCKTYLLLIYSVYIRKTALK